VSFNVTFKGAEHTGELRSDGKLYWDFGEVWQKQERGPGSPSPPTTARAWTELETALGGMEMAVKALSVDGKPNTLPEGREVGADGSTDALEAALAARARSQGSFGGISPIKLAAQEMANEAKFRGGERFRVGESFPTISGHRLSSGAMGTVRAIQTNGEAEIDIDGDISRAVWQADLNKLEIVALVDDAVLETPSASSEYALVAGELPVEGEESTQSGEASSRRSLAWASDRGLSGGMTDLYQYF